MSLQHLGQPGADIADARRQGVDAADAWPRRLYRTLRDAGIDHMSYVPDAGHSGLIRAFEADRDVTADVLTTEEEGIAIAAGAWLGGRRSVVLMQSSGVGNCVNMLSLPAIARLPLLLLVTMRGEWDEFNPWQMPMGRAVAATLGAMGVHVVRAETADDIVAMAGSAARMAFEADGQVAVLIAQRVLGKKVW